MSAGVVLLSESGGWIGQRVPAVEGKGCQFPWGGLSRIRVYRDFAYLDSAPHLGGES